MKVRIEASDFAEIAEEARKELQTLFPNDEGVTKSAALFGPEFLAKPLRLGTASAEVDFNGDQVTFIKTLRQELKEREAVTPEEKQEKKEHLQHLDSIVLFGKLLLAQAASRHFLKKAQLDGVDLDGLQGLVTKEGIQYADYSKKDTLERRKDFDTQWKKAYAAINDKSGLDETKRQALLQDLEKAKTFFYQANDLNFQHANTPSRSYSTFVNYCEKYGGRVGLGIGAIALTASALALFPPLTPIMAPIAFIASMTSLAISTPLALKNITTMIYNLVHYGAKPTPAEVVNASLFASSIILTGTGSAISHAVSVGTLHKTSETITKGVTLAHNTSKLTYVGAMQAKGIFKSNAVKSELEHIKEAKKEELASDNKLAPDSTH